MWDTSKDYRILVAIKSKDLFLKTMQTGSFRGSWNKKMAKEVANSMNSDFQTLSYSYLDCDDLVKSEFIKSLKEKADEIVEHLGGEDWNKKFLTSAPKEDKEKTIENIAKVKFFLDTIYGLKERISLGPIDDPIIGVDIKVGEIMSVSKHPKADSLMICNVNLGNRAITVVTNDLNVKEGWKVGVALLPPQTFMDITSEGMFLGLGNGILNNVKGELGMMPKGIPIESLKETRNLVDAFLK